MRFLAFRHYDIRRWRAWLGALLLVCGQLGGWLHLASHHSGENNVVVSVSAGFQVPDALASPDAHSDEEDTCLVCLALAAFSFWLIASSATTVLPRPPLHRDGIVRTLLFTLAAVVPVARGPPRFS